MKAVLASPRTVAAIRTADAISRNLGGGKMRKGTPSQPSGETYEGPFKCVMKDATTVTVQGYNYDEERYFVNYVILGDSRISISEADVEGITLNSYIYLDITYSSGYSAAIASAESLPLSSSTHYYIPLAFVICIDEEISSITQMQFGIIEGAGRIF